MLKRYWCRSPHFSRPRPLPSRIWLLTRVEPPHVGRIITPPTKAGARPVAALIGFRL